ncbi:MAG TPA: DUF3035 domain-containing protein [Azospirillum sp.]|nr:DUF3035 domain-containing protein [Azospirillum sp.]
MGLALAALAVSGCSDVRRSIGLDRASPDEFSVVSRAPLSMPPDLRLPPPRPGAMRPQDAMPSQAAAATVLGVTPAGGSSRGTSARPSAESRGEMALLSKAGADRAEPNIRATVDQETTALIVADRQWIDTLLFWQKQEQPYTVVDPQKESQRLREAQAQGKPVNDGTVPTISRKRKGPLEGLF